VVTERQQRIVASVLAAVDYWLPSEIDVDDSNVGEVFGVAATRHAANLLSGELDLAVAGRWSLTRLLGRSITESWLWANLLLLDGEGGIERLMAEDANHQHRLATGHNALWDRLESGRSDRKDLRGLSVVPSGEWRRPNIQSLAHDVRSLRERRGLGGGIAEVSYELVYRWESVHDVHVGFDLLSRYLAELTSSAATVLAEPEEEDVNHFRGPDSLHQDARLVLDLVGVYLIAVGRGGEVAAVANAISVDD